MITEHAKQRARKRVGVANIQNSFASALESGMHQRDLKGQLLKFINKGARQHKATAIIYKGYVYWHNPKTLTLITVIPLHQKWHKYIKEA